jgi:hypothetical protein
MYYIWMLGVCVLTTDNINRNSIGYVKPYYYKMLKYLRKIDSGWSVKVTEALIFFQLKTFYIYEKVLCYLEYDLI